MMWGVLFGGIIFGVMADKYGRKTPLMIAITLQCVMSYIASVLPSYWLFLVFWCILAIASGGVGIISFVISMEVNLLNFILYFINNYLFKTILATLLKKYFMKIL